MAPLSLRRLAWFDVLSRSESQGTARDYTANKALWRANDHKMGCARAIRKNFSNTHLSPIERFAIGDFALLLDAALENSVICAHG